MSVFDIIIKKGLIFDGSGSEPFSSDIGVTGDRIAFIGGPANNSLTDKADIVIDAEGMAVSPGFIDAHAHSDFTIVADPRAEGKLLQGVTSEINGNCGMSAAPLLNKVTEKREGDLQELGIGERWKTFGEYAAIIAKKGIGLNMAFLAGHGNIRGSVVGYDNRRPAAAEMTGMRTLLSDSLTEGMRGLSTGLIYPPGIYSDTEELIELCRTFQGREIIYASHMRSEGRALLEAVGELLTIGREAGVRVHVSHIKTAGSLNWHKAESVISLLRDARASGIRVTCDRYPYTASSTDLDSLLPSWAYAGGDEEELRRLTDDAGRRRMASELSSQTEAADYWEKIIVSSVSSEKNRWMEGRTLAAIGKEMGLNGIDCVFEILIQERLRVSAIFLSMSEDNLRKFLSLPFCMIGSDSSARCFDGPTKQGKPHPRTFGTFPRLFGKYVREEGLLSLSDAVRKATALAAETFGLAGRGRLKEGMYADIVIFDPERIIDKATFEDPYRKPEGVHHVIVNGKPAVTEGEYTGSLTGRIL